MESIVIAMNLDNLNVCGENVMAAIFRFTKMK